MKKLSVILAATFFVVTSAFAVSDELINDERPITFEQLPAAAQSFIKSNFGKEEISFVIKDNGILFDEYSVAFVSGDKLEFDDKGQWTEVKCRYSAVPNNIVPHEISDYVKKHNPSAKIVEIKRDRKEWEVKLSGGLELKFNSSFRLVEIDD